MMNSEIDRTRTYAFSLLEHLPCEFAEIRLQATESFSLSLAGKSLEDLSFGSTIAGSVRVLKNGAWGFIAFNDLAALETYVRKAIAIAESARSSRRVSIIRTNGSIRASRTEPVRDFRSVLQDEKFELLRGYNEILMSSEKIQSTKAVYRDVCKSYSYMNTDGSCCVDEGMFCGISFTSVAKEGSVMQPYHESVAGYGGFELVSDRAALAEHVVKTAVDLLSADSVPGGNYRVVVDQRLAGVFIHEAFGHLSEADFLYENEDMRAQMTLGKVFGPPELNVIDDGSLENVAGYIPFDDEGVAPLPTRLISGGILSGRLHSRETAGAMGEELTGNARAIGVMKQPIVRMTNTYIENGTHPVGDILASAGDGIYAAGNIGGMTNLEMFTFTADHGYEIKNGRKGKMYRDIMLSGNVFSTLRNIVMIGNDLQMFGGLGGCGKGGQGPLPVSFGGPHLLIDNVLIGGKQ